MMKTKFILSMVAAATMYGNAIELERDNDWNLVGICQDMLASGIDLTNISEIQTQDGLSLYTGEWAKYSNVTSFPAGYGIWVKAKAGIDFNVGESRGKILKPLLRDGDYTLMASCEQRDISTEEMNSHDEIQDQDGKTAYRNGSAFETHSNLSTLTYGKGYWLKGAKDSTFKVKDNLTVPKVFSYQAINNLGETVETTYNGYTIKLFTNYEEQANSQASHTAIVVRVDGVDAPIMQVQGTYRDKEVVAAIYNDEGKIVGVTENVVANSVGIGTFIDIVISDDGSTEPSVNHTPTITGTPSTTATVESEYSFTPTANDSDGDSLTFSVTGKPSWLSFEVATGKLSGTPSATDVDTSSSMLISVSDGEKSASLASFTLNVSSAECVDEMTDNFTSYTVAKDNALGDIVQSFNGFEVKVTSTASVNATSSGTVAIYGSINGDNTASLLKLNANYAIGSSFVVKVYKDAKLVGMSSELVSGSTAINFGSITTLSCSE
ncbi:MAG: Unknown protein [uncultured Sulfurovum sp.]|uniref:Dystroglycan-type cadherin-like domain-containing protein n=1 Tax=uncultured Sulfurovum sp. TaxID=269237 RepID=A0A6S6T3T3_9BACT|nr:MAG: Unknown protein [uncultured Sulfurovum sp.]